MKANQDIRYLIESNRLRYFEVAEKIGISDSRFSVWLRKELEGKRKKQVLKAIDELVNTL